MLLNNISNWMKFRNACCPGWAFHLPEVTYHLLEVAYCLVEVAYHLSEVDW